MENRNKSSDDNNIIEEEEEESNAVGGGSTRTPFNDLSQVDADLVLARTLQEQERAYMLLRMNGEGSVSDYASSDAASYSNEEEEDNDDVFDVHQSLEEEDSSALTSDEAFARALQDAEEQQLAARIMALTAATWDEQEEDHSDDDNSQATWEEVDPDELSYEELLALGEVVGTESRGLSPHTIATLPSINYKSQTNQDNTTDQCVICRLEYEDEDTLTVLSCKHMYHSECIHNWLHINKVKYFYTPYFIATSDDCALPTPYNAVMQIYFSDVRNPTFCFKLSLDSYAVWVEYDKLAQTMKKEENASLWELEEKLKKVQID